MCANAVVAKEQTLHIVPQILDTFFCKIGSLSILELTTEARLAVSGPYGSDSIGTPPHLPFYV